MFRIMMWVYNLILPLGFIGFSFGLVMKLILRPGWKSTYYERFGFFSRERKQQWKSQSGGVWIHAVSVGETVVALSLIRKMLVEHPNERIILSTTTTTGQALARANAPAGVEVIFSPIDFYWTVSRFFRLLKVEKLVILETEIWPNMILLAKRYQVVTYLVNARMSDHSSKGYFRFRFFFAPLLATFQAIGAQSEADGARFQYVSPNAKVKVTGNMKFDQYVDDNLKPVDFSGYFGQGDFLKIIAASTHPGEEKLIIESYKELLSSIPNLRLIIAPRHAERGGEVVTLLNEANLSFSRRSIEAESTTPVNVILADTTGELLALMKGSDIVIMGKSLAGQDEGHNLIEPALLGKPTVCGAVLRNFRFVLDILTAANGVAIVESDEKLTPLLMELLSNEQKRTALGERANQAIRKHAGAIKNSIELLYLTTKIENS